MSPLALHEFHARLGARFGGVNGMEAVLDYGELLAEHTALRESAGVLDLSFRSRLCVTGADRQRFLHGQVTNSVKDLATGQGCYAALVSARGKMHSDLNLHILTDEILLDFEPGFAAAVAERLEKFIIADDVQVVDVSPHYGLLSVQGPAARDVLNRLDLGVELPAAAMNLVTRKDASLGEIHWMNQPRTGTNGFDLFVPVASVAAVAGRLTEAAKPTGGRVCGWQALETARIEAGIPRFGADMDETNLPTEAGIESRAISYAKGCYIGQEVIARIRTYGQVAKTLRGLRLANDLPRLPVKGDKLFKDGKEAGYVTSAVASPSLKANIALGYVRREANQAGTELTLRTGDGESTVTVVDLPFRVG